MATNIRTYQPNQTKIVYNSIQKDQHKNPNGGEMAKKEVSLYDGKITVIVDDKYDVYPKDMPTGLDPNIDWLGNFGISEKKTGKKINGKVPKYEVDTPDREGKTLYFWDGSKVKEVPGQGPKIKKDKKKYRKGELDLGDPPLGWDR
jgi:hypothetical protein